MIKPKKIAVLIKAPIVIGSRFTGKPSVYLNTGTGEYQHVLPAVDLDVQKAILQKTVVNNNTGDNNGPIKSIANLFINFREECSKRF